MEKIKQRVEEHRKMIELISEECSSKIKQIAEEIIKCYKNGNKVVIFGNGGSCADSSHIAGEMVGRFYLNRKSLPAISLSDSTNITAIGNDFGYEFVFEKQIEGIANKGDVVIGISTSGNSVNVIKGVEKAKVTITNAIIGIVIVLLAWIILRVVVNVLESGASGSI